jgi:hypothetical protein
VAKIAKTKGEDGDKFEVVAVVLERGLPTAGDDRRYPKQSDTLGTGVLPHRVMLYEGSIWRLVTIPMHSAHAEWA